MKVSCYWNLRTKVYSMVALEGPNKGRVVRHCREFSLTDVKFVVQKAGRERVLREKQKNVHAYVRGTLSVPHYVTTEVHYNPYRHSTFVDGQGNPILSAKYVNGTIEDGQYVLKIALDNYFETE